MNIDLRKTALLSCAGSQLVEVTFGQAGSDGGPVENYSNTTLMVGPQRALSSHLMIFAE